MPRVFASRDFETGFYKIYTWIANLENKFMGTLSIWHIVILAAAALLLFGGNGKISDLMGDVARGIKAFRTGLNDTESDQTRLHALQARRNESAHVSEIDSYDARDHQIARK